MQKENIYNVSKDYIEETFPVLIKKCEKQIFKKSILKSSSWKKNYQSIQKDYNENGNLKIDHLYKPIPYDPNLLSLTIWFYSLEVTNNNSEIFAVPNMQLSKILKDKCFLNYYFKVLASIEVLKKKNSYNDTQITMFFGSLQRVIMSYFLIKEKNISREKTRKLLSFIYSESSEIYVSIRNDKIDTYLEQIKTGVKNVVIKDNVKHNNISYTKNDNIDILTTISNSIRIKYQSSKNGIHSTHKSPITHIRKAHTRTLKCGKVIQVKSSTINPNKTFLSA